MTRRSRGWRGAAEKVPGARHLFSFAKANCIEVDGHLVILDEHGVLYLADAGPEGLEVLARTELLNRHAWTVPTLVGSKLYARDQRRIVAVDLS